MGLFSSKKPPKLKLKPVGIATGYGTASVNPKTGQYGYTLDPRLASMRDMFYGAAEGFAPTEQETQFAQGVQSGGQDIFGLGQDWLGQATAYDPNAAGQQYYSDVMKLQSADRAAEEARLADTMFRTGRTGAATSYDGGYLNPEQFALLKAREQANQGLAIKAEDLGRSRQQQMIDQALGLSKAGLGQYQTGFGLEAMPYETMNSLFGYGTGIEGLGANLLPFALQANQQQMGIQQAMQQNKASRQSGGFGGLFGGLLSSGLSAMGGWSGLGSAVGGLFGGGTSSGSGGGSGYDFNPYSVYTPVGGAGVKLF